MRDSGNPIRPIPCAPKEECLTGPAILGTFRTSEGLPLIKSELVDRISLQNRHLHRHEAERIVNIIFSEITAAMVRRDRVELRGFGTFFVKFPGRRDWTKSSHRGFGFGRKKGRSILQERERNEVPT
jgi:hypothetical protein